MTTPSDVATAAGRALRTLTAPVIRMCAVCGQAFETRGRGLYCGNTCKTRAARARKREALKD